MSNAKPTSVGGHEEPDESRDSSPDLLGPGGEIPLGYSTVDISNIVPRNSGGSPNYKDPLIYFDFRLISVISHLFPQIALPCS